MPRNKFSQEEKGRIREILYGFLRNEHLLSSSQLAIKLNFFDRTLYGRVTPSYLNKEILPIMLESKKIGIIGPEGSIHDYKFTDNKEAKELFKEFDSEISAWKGKGE